MTVVVSSDWSPADHMVWSCVDRSFYCMYRKWILWLIALLPQFHNRLYTPSVITEAQKHCKPSLVGRHSSNDNNHNGDGKKEKNTHTRTRTRTHAQGVRVAPEKYVTSGQTNGSTVSSSTQAIKNSVTRNTEKIICTSCQAFATQAHSPMYARRHRNDHAVRPDDAPHPTRLHNPFSSRHERTFQTTRALYL